MHTKMKGNSLLLGQSNLHHDWEQVKVEQEYTLFDQKKHLTLPALRLTYLLITKIYAKIKQIPPAH